MKRLQILVQGMLVLALTLALATGSFANINNIASITYQDAASNNYTGQSNNGTAVVVVTPPVVNAPPNQTLDIGVAMTPVTVTANVPTTSFSLTGAPTGISINSTTGVISGTPAAGTSGSYTASLTATNVAGTSAAVTFTITVRGAASIALTKAADVSHAISGDIVTYTIGYTNSGAGAASNVVITDVIPAGSTFKTGSITGGGSYASGTNTITWTIPTVNSGGSGSVTFKVTVQ